MSDPESLEPIEESIIPLSLPDDAEPAFEVQSCAVITAHELAQKREMFEVLCTTDRTQLAVMELSNGQTSGEFGSDHPQSDQIFYVIEGTGQLLLEEDDYELHPGDTGVVPAGARHQFMGKSEHPFRTVNIYGPVAYPEEA